MLILMMKGQAQHVSEPRHHQQWYLMRLSELNYPRGNKDRGQCFLLPTDIYRTCWVFKALQQWRAVCRLIKCYGRRVVPHLLLKDSRKHFKHMNNHFKFAQLRYCIGTAQHKHALTFPRPSPADIMRCPPPPLRIIKDQSYAHSMLTFPPS